MIKTNLKGDKMDEKQFKILNDKLDKLTKLLAHTVVSNVKGDEQVKILSSIGFKSAEISDLLGKTRNSIDQSLHRIKKK